MHPQISNAAPMHNTDGAFSTLSQFSGMIVYIGNFEELALSNHSPSALETINANRDFGRSHRAYIRL